MKTAYSDFSLLDPGFPTTPKEIKALSNPLARGELMRAYELYQEATQKTSSEFEKYVCHILSRIFGQTVRHVHVREALQIVRSVYETLILRVPEEIRHNLKSDGLVRTTQNLRDLFIYWFEPGAHGGLQTASVEARTHWVLFCIAIEIVMTPQINPEMVANKMAKIMAHLNQDFFSESADLPRSTMIWCDTETATGDVAEHGFGSRGSLGTNTALTHHTYPKTLLRYITHEGEGIPVLLKQVNKDPVSIILKCLVSGIRNLHRIDDRYRFCIVVVREGDEKKVREYLRQTLTPLPGFVCDFKTLPGGVRKYNYPILGDYCEIMVTPLKAHLEEMTAKDTRNHGVYKGEKYVTSIYPIIFPTEAYGIDWSSPDIRNGVIDGYRRNPL